MQNEKRRLILKLQKSDLTALTFEKDKEPERPQSTMLPWLVRWCLHSFISTAAPSSSFKQVSGQAEKQDGGKVGGQGANLINVTWVSC